MKVFHPNSIIAAAILLISTVFCVTSLTSAQQCPVQLLVTVVDKEGHVVHDLGASDFSVEIGGSPVTVRSAAELNGPKRLIVLLDATPGLTRSSLQWNQAISSIRLIVEGAPPGLAIGMLTHTITSDFHDNSIRLKDELAVGKTAILKKLNELLTNPPIYKDYENISFAADKILSAALDRFSKVKQGDSFVIVSEGELDGHYLSHQTMDKLANSPVKLYALWLEGRSQNPSIGNGLVREYADFTSIRNASVSTGALALNVGTSNSDEKAKVMGLVEQVERPFLLNLDTYEVKKKNSKIKIGVAGRNQQLTVLSRTEIGKCSR